MSDATDADGDAPDFEVGGRCAWCGTAHENYVCGTLPIPGSGGGDGYAYTTVCVNCWAEQAAIHTSLPERVAKTIIIERLGFGRETLSATIGRNVEWLHEQRAAALTEIAPGDPARDLLAEIGITPPPAPVSGDDANGA